MKALHFDCFSGISGDMTLGALLDAGVDDGLADIVRTGLGSLGLPIRLQVERIRKGGFLATQVIVEAPEETTHRHLPEIEEILRRGQLTSTQLDLASRIFRRLADAEATVHGLPIEKVHFHEVGALDSIADIVGVAIALDHFQIQHFSARSVVTGHGTVKCAHGTMPIPTPATVELLRGAPLAATTIRGELTTPTGAAILATLVQEWTEAPALRLERVGHGAGQRELLDQPNLLRIFLGESTPQPVAPKAEEHDTVWVLETNLDDVPSEVIGYTFERLFAAGAIDVFTTPIQMKKNRPGILLSALCSVDNLGAVEQILFQETGTFGVRRSVARRTKLRRAEHTISTPWGPIRGKRGWRQDWVGLFTPEYEDCARVARTQGIPLREVYDAVRLAYQASQASEE